MVYKNEKTLFALMARAVAIGLGRAGGDLLFAVLMEKGINPMNNSTGCIPDTGFFRYTQGYNAVADPLLEKRFGSDYMTHVKEEVARRMNII